MNKKQKQHQMIYPGAGLGVKVVGSTREDLSFALKTFKKKVKNILPNLVFMYTYI